MSSRAHFNRAVIRRASGAPADGTVQLFQAGSSTAFTGSIYTTVAGATTVTNPFSFTGGVIDFYLDQPARLKLVITPTGGTAQTFDNVDVTAPVDYVPAHAPYSRQYLTRSI